MELKFIRIYISRNWRSKKDRGNYYKMDSLNDIEK